MREPQLEGPGDTLVSGDVHVWSVALDDVFPSEHALQACLSAEERARSEAMRGAAERGRFVRSRIALRHVLALYHRVSPDALPLQRESGGRPFIAAAGSLSFSLTHSRDLALIAVAARPVGVDVERVRPIESMLRIARRVLHEDTVATLEALPDRERLLAFFDAWTQREAHVKALGGGVFRTPDDLPFEPALRTDGTAVHVRARSTNESWSVIRFEPVPGWRACVAAPGRVQRLVRRTWSGDDSTAHH